MFIEHFILTFPSAFKHTQDQNYNKNITPHFNNHLKLLFLFSSSYSWTSWINYCMFVVFISKRHIHSTIICFHISHHADEIVSNQVNDNLHFAKSIWDCFLSSIRLSSQDHYWKMLSSMNPKYVCMFFLAMPRRQVPVYLVGLSQGCVYSKKSWGIR